jgi:hypothetical protein
MLCNIIDHRARPHRWKRINAILEATAHDNNVADADQAPASPDDVTYDQREGITVAEAVAWANGEKGAVTLYLYDEGEGAA